MDGLVATSESPVENGAKHPIFGGFNMFQPSFWCRISLAPPQNHHVVRGKDELFWCWDIPMAEIHGRKGGQHVCSRSSSLGSIHVLLAWWCNFTILKNHGVRQWVSDDIPYMKWEIIHSCLKPPTRLVEVPDENWKGKNQIITIHLGLKG